MWKRGEEELAGSGERGDEIESLGHSRRQEDVTLRQDARNVATYVRMDRMQVTQKIRRLCQDATPTDQTQDLFLLI